MESRLWIPLVTVLVLLALLAVAVACSERRRNRSGSARPDSPGAESAATSVTSADAPARSEVAAETPRGGRKRPPPPAAGERVEERLQMVATQIEHSLDGREPVTSEAVLDAMRVVPRHVFVPASKWQSAYSDTPLPIGHGQTISQPYIVARMTELLELTPQSRVLEVGTGSGYQAAVLAHLTPRVYTVEIVKPLADLARKTLAEQGYTEVSCRCGDGYNGWPEEAPFDAIIVTCAPERLPRPLWEQLAPLGRIVIPIGSREGIQKLVLVTKTPEGKRRDRMITFVRFVPLTRGTAGED